MVFDPEMCRDLLACRRTNASLAKAQPGSKIGCSVLAVMNAVLDLPTAGPAQELKRGVLPAGSRRPSPNCLSLRLSAHQCLVAPDQESKESEQLHTFARFRELYANVRGGERPPGREYERRASGESEELQAPTRALVRV